MPRFKLTNLLIGALAAHDVYVQIQAFRASILFLQAQSAYEETERGHLEQIEYLKHLLDEHDVPIEEFDIIAFNYHNHE